MMPRSRRTTLFAKRTRFWHTNPRFLATVQTPGSRKRRRPVDDRPVEEVYQRLSPVDHVLLRPDMYVGSTTAVHSPQWIVDSKSGCVASRNVKHIPGLVKLFDEVLVNAADNRTRSKATTRIDVTIGSQRIEVRNNGPGIPVEVHESEGMYVPELVLGHVLTGSNFDDDDGKLTGGRHGFGAKLTNILSQQFEVETLDKTRRRLYLQHWRNNMSERDEPEVTKLGKGKHESFTRVAFEPDLSRFGLRKRIDTGSLGIMRRRVYDIAGLYAGQLTVTLNGKTLEFDSFADYAELYRNTQPSIVNDKSATSATLPPAVVSRNSRWEVVLFASPLAGNMVDISFVNNISTTNGGTHVAHVADQIARGLADIIARKHADLNVTPAHVRAHLGLFINCKIESPHFDSQMKERLTSHPANFGSEWKCTKRFLLEIVSKTGIVERVVESAQLRQLQQLKRAGQTKQRGSGRILGIPKLEDANKAGRVGKEECTLILTEGDSAKALAVAGVSIVGRDYLGVFPLRGKPLNVRDATARQVAGNKELSEVCQILGLKHGKSYSDDPEVPLNLRYGKVMLMTDQDFDGSHIKGLLMNFFHFYWPELLRRPGFLLEFRTPIIKATPKKKVAATATGGANGVMSFYSVKEYEKWRATLGAAYVEAGGESGPGAMKNWRIKYYKGLGTSTAAEAREYFSNLPEHVVEFGWPEVSSADFDDETTYVSSSAELPASGTTCTDDLIDMAFSKHRSADRKGWLLRLHDAPTSSGEMAPSTAFQRENKIRVRENLHTLFPYDRFINEELALFSQYDVHRSIPSVVDGLKPSQRKVLYACLRRKLNEEIKVAQLSGYCSEHTAYHHGEASLQSTIVNMAQDFVGSNNLPLLVPSGQFGTRLQGGKDAASARYIFTKLQSYTRLIFPEADDVLLDYNEDDGEQVVRRNPPERGITRSRHKYLMTPFLPCTPHVFVSYSPAW